MDSHEFSAVGGSEIKSVSPRIFDGITRWSLYLLFFLVPLIFLPWTSDVFEINKQTLFVIGSGVAFASWLFSMVLSRRLEFRTGAVVLLPALFLLTAFLSSIFSLAGYQSWVGQLSQEYTSFLSIAMFVLFFYVVLHKGKDAAVQHGLLFALFLAGAISSLIAFCYSIGFNIIPGIDILGFNPTGTVNTFIGFSVVLMFAGAALWLVSRHGSKSFFPDGARGWVLRLSIAIISVVTLFLMLALDFWLFWVMNILGVVLLAGFGLLSNRAFPSPKRFVLPLLVLVVSLVFLFAPSPYKLKMPLVVSPSHGTSWDIASKVVGENSRQLFFGSGPGTFMYDFAEFRPMAVNPSRFWNVRFDRARSHVLTTLATFGILGALAWIVFVGYMLVRSLSKFLGGSDPDDWKLSYTLFVGWALLLFLHIFYVSNFSLQFLFWGLTALLATHIGGRMLSANFREAPRLSLGSVFVFVLIGVGIVTAIFLSVSRYAADVSFAKALRMSSANASATDVVNELARSIRYNRFSDTHYQAMGRVRLAQAAAVLREVKDGKPTQEQLDQISALVKASVEATTRSTTLAPNDSQNWALQAATYRDLMSYANNAEEFAVAAINQAITLEPNNPSHHSGLGLVHLALADRARALLNSQNKELAAAAKEAFPKSLQAAKVSFEKALSLKQDYAPAHYQLAIVSERAGQLLDATNRLTELTKARPLDIGLGFELGVLLLRQNQAKEAQAEFERILGLQPDYANAIWYLASALELQGKRPEAMAQIQKLIDKDPMNTEIQDRMARLRRGELTTHIAEPVEPIPLTTGEVQVQAKP